MVSYKSDDHEIVCVGRAGIDEALKGRKALLNMLPSLDVSPGEVEYVKVPVESDFKKNPVAVAAQCFKALDELPRPLVANCESGRRARVVIAAWVAVRKGGDADGAVEHLKAVGDHTPDKEHWVRGVVAAHTVSPAHPLIFRQLFEKESSTYTYLLADAATREAILIDPVDLTVDRDLKVIDTATTPDGKAGLTLTKALNTHCHADHITGTAQLKGKVPKCKSIISKASGAKADVYLEDGEKISFGGRWVEVIATPGHTDGCISFVLDDRSMVFTGDALLIMGCGRTDFQQGNSKTLYTSVRDRLFTLPPECIVYPAHDYNGRMSSTIASERTHNPRLGDSKTVEEFVDIMANLNLAYPKKIDQAVPANLLCGFPDEASWVPAK